MSNKPTAQLRQRSWRDVLPVHPAADLFPMMPPEERMALGEDIKENGLRTRVAVINGSDGNPILLDGRNRLDAMEAVGIDIVLTNIAVLVDCETGFDGKTKKQIIAVATHLACALVGRGPHGFDQMFNRMVDELEAEGKTIPFMKLS